MKLSVFCSPQRRELLPQLVPLFDEMFIESHVFFFTEAWNREALEHLDRGLAFADNYLVIPAKEDFGYRWVSYIMGFAGGCKKNVVFHMSPDPGFEPHKALAELFHASYNEEELHAHMSEVLDVWSEEMRRQMAQKLLEEKTGDHVFQGLAQAVETGDRFLVGAYLDAGFDINREAPNHISLLGLASRKGFTNLVYVLFEAGAEINQISSDRNNSPLMDAASTGHIDIVRFFIENGADLELKSRSNQTALVLAVGNKQIECAKLLLEAGAEPDEKDSLGLSARKYAELYNMEELIALMPALPQEENT